jgi:hypothetical protein
MKLFPMAGKQDDLITAFQEQLVNNLMVQLPK